MRSLTPKNTAHAVAGTTLLGLALVYHFAPAEQSFYPACLFARLTGWECPGCGSTRALHALLHLRMAEAMGLNPLFTALFPLVFVCAVVQYVSLLRTGGFIPFLLPKNAYVLLFLFVMAFGIFRNVSLWSIP